MFRFFLKNFREFAVRGTVVDMAIGVIVGTAFLKVVESLVTDIVMPPVGLVLGRVDFSNLYITLSGTHYRSLIEAKEAGAVTVNYGMFIDSIIHFAIVTFAAYFTILQINRIKKAPVEAISSKECPYCFISIPTRAVKCPKCTSVLVTEPKEEETKEKKMKKQKEPVEETPEKPTLLENKDVSGVRINFK